MNYTSRPLWNLWESKLEPVFISFQIPLFCFSSSIEVNDLTIKDMFCIIK